MQLLERKDKQKWFVWIAQGTIHESDLNNDKEDEINTSELNSKF